MMLREVASEGEAYSRSPSETMPIRRARPSTSGARRMCSVCIRLSAC